MVSFNSSLGTLPKRLPNNNTGILVFKAKISLRKSIKMSLPAIPTTKDLQSSVRHYKEINSRGESKRVPSVLYRCVAFRAVSLFLPHLLLYYLTGLSGS